MSKLKSKWELFNMDLDLLPEGDIIINTEDGFIHTNKKLIEETKDMAKKITEELNKENTHGT